MSVKFDEPRVWQFAANVIRVVDSSTTEGRTHKFGEVPLNFGYKVPLATRVTDDNNSQYGGQTKVGFTVNLGGKEPPKYTIELPAVQINGVLYQFKLLELERRMIDVGIEPFNC
jgi:hypothetical protein